MTAALNLAAVDLGAESGRVMLASLQGDRLALAEAHRFANVPVRVGDSLHWDILRLWADIQEGLARCAQVANGPLASVGVDGWGVDFGLLARDGSLIGNPVHYRDGRTQGMMQAAFDTTPRAEIFERTGIQFMPINSLYQLLSLSRRSAPELEAATRLLMIPDLIHYWLSGAQATEFTNATTTQCYDPRTGDWARPMLARLGIPDGIFGPVTPPGSRLGEVRPALAAALGLGGTAVIAPASHDTGSAVAGAPLPDRQTIYLSSGTWSLMGVETDAPIINAQSLDYNFTNEGGVGGTFRLLKNIMGLWLVQECRRAWSRQGEEFSYSQLLHLAEQAPAFGPLVLASDERFLAPGDMPARIRAFCQESSQAAPESPGAVVRCALESLALEYRWVAERLDELTGQRLDRILVIGGGAQNALLNQFTADAAQRVVEAGPAEASALGNALVQAIGLGALGSLDEGRALVRRSTHNVVFSPGDAGPWEDAYGRFCRLRAEASQGS